MEKTEIVELLNTLKCKKIILMGSATKFLSNKIKKSLNIDVEIYNSIETLQKEKVIFAIGNIGGDGMKLLDYYKKEGEKIC